MYKYFSLFVMMLALTFTACQNKQKSTEASVEKSCCSSESVQTKVYSLEDLLDNASSLVDKEVAFKGTVNHVCKHGGKKCFMNGDDPTVAIQVMAKGSISVFDKELIGSEITVKGVMKERRMTKADVEKQEQAMKEKMAKEEHGEHGSCGHGMKNVDMMKKWMADNNKDYYPVYFVEGTEYEKVQ